MRKKYILPAVLLVMLAFIPSQGSAAIEQWAASKAVAAGVKTITNFLQTVIRLTDTFGSYDVSFSVKFPIPVPTYYNRLAIKFGASSNPTYTKMLEMWTSKDGGTTYVKGLEFSYKTDATKALIVFHPAPFINNTTHPQKAFYNSKFKLEYDGSAAPKWMKFNADHGGTAVNNTLKSAAYLEQGSTYYDVYVTSHLDTSFGGTATNDAYTFGARILTANTAHYYTLAKQGVSDIKASGNSYDFLVYGGANPYNCAQFDKADADGFVADGYSGSDANYPLPADIVESKLPDVDDVENTSFDFATPAVF